MAFGSFVPNLWTATLLTALRKEHKYMALVNRDYEGIIKQGGDSVAINQISDVAVSDYTDAAGVTFERLDTSSQSLLIDQQKYFAFDVSDIEKA